MGARSPVDVEKRAQELAERIKGNVSSLDLHKSWFFFMKAQRETWDEVAAAGPAVAARVNEILHPERTEGKKGGSGRRPNRSRKGKGTGR